MMKLLFVIHDITRGAGTEKATITLVNSLIKEGYEVEIISIASNVETPLFFQLSEQAIVHHNAGGTGKLRDIWTIKNILKDRRPYIIFGTGHNISFFLPFIKNSGSKVVALEHIDFVSIPKTSKKLIQFSYSKLNGIVVLSDNAKRKVFHLNKKVEVIPNQIVSSENQSDLSKELILLVGRISEEKAYERLVPIAEFLQKRYPTWKIEIYGSSEDEYKNSLLDLYQKNKLSNITICPPNKNIESKYVESSIFMITSKFEAFPLVILEAKSHGVPVVGFKNEGTESLINDGEDGYVVENSSDSISKIESLILDLQLRRHMGEKGRQNIQQYKEDHIVDKRVNFMNQLKK